MKETSYAQIQEELSQIDFSQFEELHITILRNIMLEPIEPYIRYLSYQAGFNAKVQLGEYDNIFQDAVGTNAKLLNNKTDCVMVFMKLETLSLDLVMNFTGLAADQVQAEIERICDYIASIVSGIRDQTSAMILWHGFETPVTPANGIWDSQINEGQLGVVRNLNEFLREHLRKTVNAFFVNTNICLTRVGASKFYDLRYWHIGRAPYSLEGLREIAFEDSKYIRALKGKNKKCLVLDCDNTLWGGIIGEDGLAGIKLGKTYPGSSYYEFQKEILTLHNRGIIIALCSKNNEGDVWDVFRNHPDMVLKERHIASAQISWNDKAAGISQIALDLNIGTDSMVFMDDTEFETHLIQKELPEVEVIHLPKDRAVENRNILASCGLFDTLTVSEEDKKRGAMYKAEASRKKAKTQATDMESYYRSLEMVIEINFAGDFTIPRIAQLTQKTNQFNLTTKRYSDADIKAFVDSENYDVISIMLSDRFGESGIVGTCMLTYEENKAIFDTFLLSCRVLGRGIEKVFITQALKLAAKRGCKWAVGEYYATPKNAQVEHFYSKQGFQELEATSNKTADKRFEYDLRSGIKREPDYFKKIDSEIDKNKGN